MPKFSFHSVSLELIDRILPNFIYAFILTRSSLGLLHVIFRSFVPEKWPLIYAKNSFPLNILRTNCHKFTKFYICIYIDKIYVGIVTPHFSLICTRVMALDYSPTLKKWGLYWIGLSVILSVHVSFRHNFVSTQYLENSFIEFIQILYVH